MLYEFLSGGPLQHFLSALAFVLLLAIAKASTRGHVQMEGGQRIMRYNIAMHGITFLILIFFSALDFMDIWLLLFHYRALAATKAAVTAVVISIILLQPFIIFMVIAMFGTRIGFDDIGVYRKVPIGRERRFSWAEISSYRRGSQIQIFGRGLGTITISKYRNGADDLIAALTAHNIPARQ